MDLPKISHDTVKVNAESDVEKASSATHLRQNAKAPASPDDGFTYTITPACEYGLRRMHRANL